MSLNHWVYRAELSSPFSYPQKTKRRTHDSTVKYSDRKPWLRGAGGSGYAVGSQALRFNAVWNSLAGNGKKETD